MPRKPSGWQWTLALFFITSMIESLTMSHVFSFLPVYLQEMQVHHIGTWVGVLNALAFVVGLPLVPLWGVWSDRFGGKAVVIRSAYVEAIVFVGLGWSHTLMGVTISMALIGFQLGNTGIMLASIRRLVPQTRVGFAVSIFSVSSPVGMALGPLLGGWLASATGLSLHGLFLVDSVLSVVTGTMLLAWYRENRLPQETPSESSERSVWSVAWTSVRVTFGLRIVWILFGVYTVLMVARQMVNPYLPIAIQQQVGQHSDLELVIGAMMGLTALIGALITVVAGRVGDAIGFSRVLGIAFFLSVPCTAMLAFSHRLLTLSVWLTGYSAVVSISVAMIFSLLSTRVPDSHRSTALNLVYLPLYVGGIIGPAVASGLWRFGLDGPFVGASIVFLVGLFIIIGTLRTTHTRGHFEEETVSVP